MSLEKTTFIYLSGDSYPADRYIEAALGERLRLMGAQFIEQHDVCGEEKRFDLRKAALLATLATLEDRRVVAIGRSSGGRIASLAASEGATFAAVVALGYPFRFPGRDEEPARTAHLATLSVPTLILQGARDSYGTKEEAEGRYPLSSSVRIVELPTSHEFRCSPDLWDKIVRLISEHVAPVGNQTTMMGRFSGSWAGESAERLVRWVESLWRRYRQPGRSAPDDGR